jgi:hypothetical protein
MSLGSPALAAYSLALTSLNARSVYHRVKASKARYKRSVVEALIPIQQTPLELTKNEGLLGFIQDNHQWREEIQQRLSRKGAWSLGTATSVAWVVTTFFLTLVDSFLRIDSLAGGASDGHAVGTIWLCLLCLVIGRVWVPIFDSGELKTALYFANKQAEVAAKKIKSTREVARRFLNIVRSRLANKRARGMGDQGNPGDVRQEPNQNTNLSANPNGTEDPTNVEFTFPQGPTDPVTDELFISKDLGSLNRDERRLSATFNYSRIMRYLVLVDDVLKALDEPAREVCLSRKRLTQVVSLISNRRGLPLGLFPLCPLRRLCSLWER